MDKARIVELWVPGTKRVGSGYLLTERLVLTAYHVVADLAPGARIKVRPLSRTPQTPWLPAELCWPPGPVDRAATPEHDASLLLIDPPGTANPPTGTVRFGRIDGPDKIPCQGVGFPNAARRGNLRDTLRVEGHVDPLLNFKATTLTVHVHTGVVPRRKKNPSEESTTGWPGASGAALFCGELLVGVVRVDRDLAEDASVLDAVPITALANLPEFRQTLTDHGVHLRFEHASPTARALAAYLDAAARTTAEHPYAGVLPGTTPPLAAVYLGQHLHRSDRDTGTPPEARANPEPVATRSPADGVLADPPTCVILSGPGGGKSSLLRAGLTHGIDAWQNDRSAHLLPVLVQAQGLTGHNTFTEALTAAATAELNLTGKLPAGFFAKPPRPGAHWLVLVDGLDEITDPDARNKVLKMLDTAATGPYSPVYRFVVATRPLPDSALDVLGQTVPRYDLAPFSPEDVKAVVRAWFRAAGFPDSDTSAQEFVSTLEDSGLAAIAQVPLMTAMLCQIHVQVPDRPLPASRGQIYHDFITLLLKQPPDKEPGTRLPGLARYGPQVHEQADRVLYHLPQFIGHLAAERHAGNTDSAVTVVQSAPYQYAQCPYGVHDDDWRAFLDASLRRSGLLTARAGDLVFLHQTLLEYLAADHALHEKGLGACEHIFDTPRRRSGRARPGITRVWGRRYWKPNEASSYVGFLIDAAHNRGLPVQDRLCRLAPRGGLAGGQFIVGLARLGTFISDDVRRVTGDLLHGLARDTTFASDYREWAAGALVELGDPRAAQLLYDLALDTTLESGNRLWAAQALVRLGEPRGIELLYDTTFDSDDRVRAAWTLVELGDPRGIELLYDLARDTTLDNYARVWAAEVLVKLGDPRAAQLLYDLALDTTLDGAKRVRVAKALAGLGDPRAAQLLYDLARDTTLNSHTRVEAAGALARLTGEVV